MPDFVYVDVVDPTRVYVRHYYEDNIETLPEERLIDAEYADQYPRDGLMGSLAVENWLDRLLTNQEAAGG